MTRWLPPELQTPEQRLLLTVARVLRARLSNPQDYSAVDAERDLSEALKPFEAVPAEPVNEAVSGRL